MTTHPDLPEEAVEAAIDVICAPIESAAPGWVDEGERESVRRQVTIVLQAAAPAIRKQGADEERERIRHQRCIDALALAIKAKKSYPEMIEYVLLANKLNVGRIHDLAALDTLEDSDG
jgi:hypothetical protein